MDINDERIREAVKRTEVIRPPRKTLDAFGTTNVYYYLITEPVYEELVGQGSETVIREGRVIAERPRIVTPYYLSNVEGFSPEARHYFEELLNIYGPDAPGMFYTYRNEPKELNIVSDSMAAVVDKLNAEIDQRGDPLASIIKGEDQLWDVSLMRFIYEMTRDSLPDNLQQFGRRGLLGVDPGGVPVEARVRIEELFARVYQGEADPNELRAELERWGLFDVYQDRFLDIFRKKR